MKSLLVTLSWPEARHHPWRTAAALLAVMLGVALAFSVQLINRSALGEFSAAVRAVNGEPDFELRAQAGGFDEELYGRVARDLRVAVASPIVDIETFAFDPAGQRVALRVLGIDPLVAGKIAPALVPHPRAGSARDAMLDPGAIFLNPQAELRLAPAGAPQALRVQTPQGETTLQIAGSIGATGTALAVMDIAGAQETFGWLGRLSRIDVRLVPGADRAAVLRELKLPPEVRAARPAEATERITNVSRAYRVNLTVLALVALFTGAFLVFSILSLSVAQRAGQLALLGVLGMGARERLRLVLAESIGLGAVGSVLGIGLGTALAALALRLLGGDLGGGYFRGVAPALQFDGVAALLYALLGIGAAAVGGWVPARSAAQIAPAQGLKGLGRTNEVAPAHWSGPLLLAVGVGLALLPPIGGLPLAAYVSVACLLIGGIACVPAGVGALVRWIEPPDHPLALLAIERARRDRRSATVAVAGVVASLSLAVALVVMVGSFRGSVMRWLETVLPADLYVRASTGGSRADAATLPPALLEAARRVPGVQRADAQRVVDIQLDPARPSVALLARTSGDSATGLPLIGTLRPLPDGAIAAYASEAMADLYAATPGSRLVLPLPNGRRVTVFVRGIWRDYARQHGAVAIGAADYRRLTGDDRISDIALWLAPGARVAAVQVALRRAAAANGFDAALLEFAEPGAIRTASLRIFDRSFAVTYWLQAIAIAIGLFGIAASFSAQVLARRKEFGLLAHLGFTRRQILGVVAAECAVWTFAGTLLGLVLGLAVSVVLVEVVNPQSFHWTMDLRVPWARLALLCAGVLAAGTATGWLAARGAASRQMALVVKEDW